MKLNKFLPHLLALLIPVLAQAQFNPPKELPYPKAVLSEPYLFPINPGQQNWLAGTMGELRNTHFHAGIDIRTNNMAGMPVLATQRGYISRVIVGTYGYGHALFITHPDGNVSVYGHLDQFKGKLGAYVLNKHYEKKSFDLDLFFTPDQFPVNRGDTVALSGNTGGSSGPHLHFEIRDEQNEALNPLTFKFGEINDVLSPVAQKIAIKTMTVNSRIDNRFGRKEYSLMRNGNNYFLQHPIQASGKIGIELLAFDRLDLSRFRCGINEIEVLVDSQKVFTQRIDRINFNNTHGIVSLMDFETMKTRGLHFNKLYVDDGNPLKYYESSVDKGRIAIGNKPVDVLIKLKDSYGNESSVTFKIVPELTVNTKPSTLPQKAHEYFFSGNVLEMHSACPANTLLKVFEKGTVTEIKSSYSHGGRQVYLLDLQKSLPDSVQTCHGMVQFGLKDKVPSGIEYTFYSDVTNIHFAPNALYDTLFLTLANSIKNEKEIFTIGRPTDPLYAPIEVTLKPRQKVTPSSKLAVYHIEGRSYEYIGGQWQNGAVRFQASEFGDFIFLTDSIAPIIHRLQCNASSARFRIGDNLSGISRYEASVNGEWLLMKYDYKTGILQSERLDHSKPLHGDFELKVTDRAGNQATYKQTIL
ncbi:MAG: M23 family metallopeptidase [Bacteroidetes bacterium]|nr:M23 family metallopeptidase [Bacteroidota bacterium]